MGNLLCVPRSPKKDDGKVTNKKSRWFIRQSKKQTNTDVGPASSTASAFINEVETILHEKDQAERGITHAIPIVSPINCHVDPVVSSCILLKPFDDDDDDSDSETESELTGIRDGTSPDNNHSEEVEGSHAKCEGSEICEGSSKNGDEEKPVYYCAKASVFTETPCPTDTEFTSEDAALKDEMANKLKPSAKMEISDEVATSLKEVDVSKADLSSTADIKTSVEISTKKEKTNKCETLSADVKESGVMTTPTHEIDVTKAFDIDVVNKVDIATSEKSDVAEDVIEWHDVPNRKDQSLINLRKEEIETTMKDVRELITDNAGEAMLEEPPPVVDLTKADTSETKTYTPAESESFTEVIKTAKEITSVKTEELNSSGDVKSKVKMDDAKQEIAHPSNIQKLDVSGRSTRENNDESIATQGNMVAKGATQEATASSNSDSEPDPAARLEGECLITSGVKECSAYLSNIAVSLSSVTERSELKGPSIVTSIQTEEPLLQRHRDVKAIVGKQLQIEDAAVLSKTAEEKTYKENIGEAKLLNKNNRVTTLRGYSNAVGNTTEVENKLTASDVKIVSKDGGYSQHDTHRIIVVKQQQSEDGKFSLSKNKYISVVPNDENKSKLVNNVIDKADNKVDECKQYLTKCTATVYKTISSSTDTMVSVDDDRGKRETTENNYTTKLNNKEFDNAERRLEKQTHSYHGVKAASGGSCKKENHNTIRDMLDNTEKKKDNKTQDLQLKAASSCPTMPKKYEASKSMKDLAKILEALSVLKVPVRSDAKKIAKSSQRFSRNVVSPHQGTSITSGFTDTHQSIQSPSVTIRESSPQHAPPSGISFRDSNTLVKSTWMSTRVVSTQQGTSGKKEKSNENKNVILTRANTATSSDSCVEPQTSTGLSGKLILAQSGISKSSECYKSSTDIQKWLQHSVSEPLPSVTVDATISGGVKELQRKVSDFKIPKKRPRPPQKPLILKTPSAHLFGLPGIAKSDLIEDKDVKWTQKDLTGPQTDVLWSSKPTSYDVKFPPLPKRLLEREGSIDKLRNSWVIPQVKQIETLKREFGRFPGLRVPTKLRNKYSVEIKDPNTDVNAEEVNAEDSETDYDDYK